MMNIEKRIKKLEGVPDMQKKEGLLLCRVIGHGEEQPVVKTIAHILDHTGTIRSTVEYEGEGHYKREVQ